MSPWWFNDWSNKQHQVWTYQVDQVSFGVDFLQLDPSTVPGRGLTAWLTDAFRAAISDGRLVPGTRLPATRVLAGELGISRGVVVEAYRRITDEGLVSGRSGGGTVVLARPARPSTRPTKHFDTQRLP